MREIKFRAWNKEEKYMLICGVGENGKPMIPVHPGDKEGTHFERAYLEEEFILDSEIMQYTGLKDKNGVEIYESDVVRYDIENVPEKLKINTVIWEGDRWRLSRFSWEGYMWGACEVIGNIYENPELLDNKD